MQGVPPLQTLDRALWVLTHFTPGQPEWGVSDLARALGLPKSVVQKTLATFARWGFLHQDPGTRRYRLGTRFLFMAQSVTLHQELVRVATPHLNWLAHETRETAKLSVEEGGESVIVAVVESPLSMRMTGRVGERNPLYAGASNLVLAAHMAWSDVLRALERHAPPDHPYRQEPELLRRALEPIARQGYAISCGQVELDVAAISAPVRAATGEVVASVSVVGPASRFVSERQDVMVRHVMETARKISRELGYDGPESTSKGV